MRFVRVSVFVCPCNYNWNTWMPHISKVFWIIGEEILIYF